MINYEPHHQIKSIQVTGGFLDGTRLEFVDGLNCIIGGRGTGKTTLLEFIRYALGMHPDARTQPQRHKALEAMVKSNLSTGRISVEVITKAGIRYAAERSQGERGHVRDERGNVVQVSLDRDQIFGADVLSQHEIEEMAADPASQLALLDRFFEKEAAQIGRELDTLARENERGADELRRLDRAIADLQATASEAPVLREKLKGLATTHGTVADALLAAQSMRAVRLREHDFLTRATGSPERIAAQVRDLAQSFTPLLDPSIPPPTDQSASSELLVEMRRELGQFNSRLANLAAELTSAAAETTRTLREIGARLSAAHSAQEASYLELLSKSTLESEQAKERLDLENKLATATTAAEECERQTAKRTEMLATRRARLGQASELRDRRFAARKLVAEDLSRNFEQVRVSIRQGSDTSSYRNAIAEALRGLPIKHGMIADRIAQSLGPNEFTRIVMTSNIDELFERTAIERERADRIFTTLMESGTIYDIQASELGDTPSVELRDGDVYKASPHLSTGQRCTTILPLLLVQSERPLVIDQPEDNLDNAYIFSNVVKALQRAKGTRQVIFVTHNPNIPVLGDAERVFVLESDGKRGYMRRSGTVDERKEDIEAILEGGREAFIRRKDRYGY